MPGSVGAIGASSSSVIRRSPPPYCCRYSSSIFSVTFDHPPTIATTRLSSFRPGISSPKTPLEHVAMDIPHEASTSIRLSSTSRQHPIATAASSKTTLRTLSRCASSNVVAATHVAPSDVAMLVMGDSVTSSPAPRLLSAPRVSTANTRKLSQPFHFSLIITSENNSPPPALHTIASGAFLSI